MRTSKIMSALLLGFASILTTLLFGCGSPAYTRHFFVLHTARDGTPSISKKQIILEVPRFAIDSAFASKSLVYRRSTYEYESDFYNEFLIWPAEMITEKTRNWLTESGLFKQVVASAGRLEPTHTLIGDIKALYGDFTERKTAAGRMEIKIAVTKKEAGEVSILFSKTYTASFQMEARNAEALVDAFDKCLIQILTELEAGLTRKL